jgi:tagatose-6-phosphate ketose/aldose isomerase
MTSSFTAMMLAASLVFHSLEDTADSVARIARGARQVLEQHNGALRKLAAESYSRVVYLGSNGLKGLAREAALKLLELTDGKVIAAFDSPLGFRHGPKTIVTADTLLVVFISNDPYTRRYDLDLLRELRSDGLAGRVIAVTAQVHDAVTQGEYLQVPYLADAVDGDLYFPYIVCGQLYAFHRSLSVGNTPDQPSNSGTVSRVVRGVTIHTL